MAWNVTFQLNWKIRYLVEIKCCIFRKYICCFTPKTLFSEIQQTFEYIELEYVYSESNIKNDSTDSSSLSPKFPSLPASCWQPFLHSAIIYYHILLYNFITSLSRSIDSSPPAPQNRQSPHGSDPSFYGTEIVVEDMRMTIQGLADHVMYSKSW